MRYIYLLTIFLFCSTVFSQKKNVDDLLIQDLIGVWQIDNYQIGSSLSECFRFYENGRFIYQYDHSDDTRNIIELKGKYRLDKNRLFFTITSQVERLGGRIIAGAVGTDKFLFVYDNDSIKDVINKNPIELYPLFIFNISRNGNKINCYINNRHYYKISSIPNKYKVE